MIVTAIVTSLAALAAAGAHGWLRGRQAPAPRPVVEHGELLVTGHGEVVIDVPLRRARGLLIKSELAAEVRFRDSEPPCPPCGVRDMPDHVHWDVTEKHHGGELYLVIRWHVACPRMVVWSVFGEGA